MNKILKYSITIPQEVSILVKKNILYVKGSKGVNTIALLNNINIYKLNKNLILLFHITDKETLKKSKLFYKLISNTVKGVSIGFFSQLECFGLGYKAKVFERNLILKLGFSHKFYIKIPKQIFIFCSKSNNIVFFSTDSQQLFAFIKKVQSYRKPDQYKGKGLKLKFETIKLKEGKKI